MTTDNLNFMELSDAAEVLAGRWPDLADGARRYLIAQIAGVKLRHAADGQEPVAWLGGDTIFGPEQMHERRLGLTPVICIDLSKVSSLPGYPSEMPASGHLTVLHDTASREDHFAPVSAHTATMWSDPDAGVQFVEHQVADGTHTYPRVPLVAVSSVDEVTASISERLADEDPADEQVRRDIIIDALHDVASGHRIGGAANAVQTDPIFRLVCDIEYRELLKARESVTRKHIDELMREAFDAGRPLSEVDDAHLRCDGDPVIAAIYDDVERRCRDWMHVLSVSYDRAAQMMWGDMGQLYVLGQRSYVRQRCQLAVALQQ